MLEVCLPGDPTISVDLDGSNQLITERVGGRKMEAKTLRELIEDVEILQNVRVDKNPEQEKYFLYKTDEVPEGILIDIHIKRGGESICPKQNVDIVLVDGDIVSFGSLAC